KTDADIFFIIEDDIEMFRLSLFTCNYKKIFAKRECFFSINQNMSEISNTFLHFYDAAFIRNHYLKFSLFAQKDAKYIKMIQTNILNRSEHCYSHAALLEKGSRVLDKISQDYKFYNTLKKDESFFNDKPMLVLGAGPSLGANAEWLKLHSDSFIIVAPFVALRVLYHLGIKPAILVHIDEGDKIAERDIKLYGGKKEFFDKTSFVFSASVSNLYFEAFNKESIYLIEDRTEYKLNHNQMEIGSVGEATYQVALNLTKSDVYLLGLDLAVSDDGSTHAKTHTTKNKVDTSSSDKVETGSSLRKTVFKVKGNFKEIVNTIPLFSSSIIILDSITKKFKLPEQNVYNLSDGAYFQDTEPLRINELSFEDKNKDVSFGAVSSAYALTFRGFYKDVDSDKVYDVDVYVDGEFIISIEASSYVKEIDREFDIQTNSFTYELDERFIGTEHLVEFKESKTQDILASSGIKTLDRNDSKFNEYKFLDSLYADVDEKRIKDLYCKDAIGFLAVEDNLNDKDFMNYIKELYVRFSTVTFKVFCFNAEQKLLVESIFENEMCRIEISSPMNIYDVVKEIEIYLTKAINLEDRIVKEIIKYSDEVAIHIRNKSVSNIRLNQLVKVDIEKSDIRYMVLQEFGISDINIKKYNYNFVQSLWSDFIYKNNIPYTFESEILYGENTNNILGLNLQYPKCKYYTIKILRAYSEKKESSL
ncbi:MAG: hypothetical protein DRG78_10200, partial [Epsilonproteobacteria bacterium]